MNILKGTLLKDKPNLQKGLKNKPHSKLIKLIRS
jgi:hypothetical protein